MKLTCDTAEIFVPDGASIESALARTTHMGVAAHQDDLEIMAFHGILECFQRDHRWFAGVVVTDGGGSPRDGLYRDFTDEAMRQVRRKEQRKAAVVGEFSFQAFLDFPSKDVKDGSISAPADDLTALFAAAQPEIVYAHNLTDRHDTHVASALRTIAALRRLPRAARPRQAFGCEVWRDLDWLLDADKAALDVSAHENLQSALLGVFDSQICGGKRYDLATLGRRRAHATYHASHATDVSTGMTYAMDLTPLIDDPRRDIGEFVRQSLNRFATDVTTRIERLS
ncbi:MAG: PIG-L family deacetylase [Vicinamibacteria bacterium]|nr:PIG-L family deacetylase [Vicinamibacteria bacterium]